ncbi:DnaA N-terminal domain-containing protein [Orientia tsutsugamushi]|uniref:DnaA N-terminal domain protein n=1 Tax=Orientia tsutsugamushi str. TA716 TaxID=1359175 RepID=A0A0F3P1A3_ORITS|nr:DnaA N-terminal domain-containing protein [Orientia tsutsugamushi]KJV73731.1 dnaA N-terminal domain protein [Orientia tsutsugamushi str. TA716]
MAQNLRNFASNNCKIANNNSSNNATVFYRFIGNFVPAEWKDLIGDNAKALSKTSKQLLSLMVYRLQIYYNKDIDELQESYYFFEKELNLRYRRVRQCLVELRNAGFIKVENRTIIKGNLKLRNVLCVKLLKNFQRFTEKEKKDQQQQQNLNFYELSDFSNKKPSNKDYEQNSELATSAITKDSEVEKNECYPKRKRLADYYPLTPEDAIILQRMSSRSFNIYFINQLLLKLSNKYPNRHFANKTAVLNYMAKALANELLTTDQANSENFRFNYVGRFKEQYLANIESGTDRSMKAQLKRKIAGVFEADMAYQILTSCDFGAAVKNKYYIKLIKNITLSDHIKFKILQEVRAVYSNDIEQLQVIPFDESKQVTNSATEYQKTTVLQQQISDKDYLSELSKELGSNSTWYKVRESLIKSYGQAIDKLWFSPLKVVNEDSVNKKIFIKAKTEFEDDYIRNNCMRGLEYAFKAQGFSFELVKFSNFNKI